MKILFLTSGRDKGGAQVVVLNAIKFMDRKRFQPILGAVAFRSGTFLAEFEKLEVPIQDFNAGHLREWHKTLAVIWRMIKFIRKEKIDAILTTGAHNHIYAALAKTMTGVALIAYVMDYYQPKWRDNHLLVKLSLCLGADYYLTCSQACMETLEKLIPPEIPRAILYHGVDPDFFSKPGNAGVREQLHLKEGQKLISIIARLQRWKGQDVFLKAAAQLTQRYPHVYFAVVGGELFGFEPDYPEALKRLVKNLGLEKQCFLVGHQPNVQDWMRASDIIVHASKTPEPGANAVMEAMAMGKPVIASACGAPSEIIQEGVSGLLFEPGNEKHLASQIISLLENSDWGLRLGEAAKKRIEDEFTAQKMTKGLEAVINELKSLGKL